MGDGDEGCTLSVQRSPWNSLCRLAQFFQADCGGFPAAAGRENGIVCLDLPPGATSVRATNYWACVPPVILLLFSTYP